MKKQSKTNWERIDRMQDDEIDYSDSPRLTADFFRTAVRWPGKKELISVRLDPDVLAFFRKQGRGYQTTINMLLRKYMESQDAGARASASAPRASRRRQKSAKTR